MVICDGIAEFELSASFLRMVDVQRAKFVDGLPFTIVAFADEMLGMYHNHNKHAHWRMVRRQSRAWAKRDKVLYELICGNYDSRKPFLDLSPDAPNLVVTDTIDLKRYVVGEKGPGTALTTALIRHMSSFLPAIAFRSGHGTFRSMNDGAPHSLFRAIDALNSGCPVVFLDVRERETCAAATRQEIIDKAMAQFVELNKALAEKGTLDSYNCCAVAWFHDVLYGDGDSNTAPRANGGGDASPEAAHAAAPLPVRRVRVREQRR
jgi:hypothetical protein